MSKTNLFNSLDYLYLFFSILYILADRDVFDYKLLAYSKPIPIWILILQLFREYRPQIFWIMVALFYGSLGDIMLLIWPSDKNMAMFAMGALKFLIGHIIYVNSFLSLSASIADGSVSLKQSLKKKGLFIVIWLIHISLAFLSMGLIEKKGVIKYVIPVYGTCLLLLTMAGFFFYFVTSSVEAFGRTPGLLVMFGTITFYLSDNFLAHANYNTSKPYLQLFEHRQWYNTLLIMVSYYVAQFLLGKGGLLTARYFSQLQSPKIKAGEEQGRKLRST